MRRVFGLLLCLLAGCSGRSATEPIFIGHLAPLSGPDQRIGQHARQGILLAVEEANQDDNARKINVIHVDIPGDEEKPERPENDRAQAQAVRLITINRVIALLGDTGSAQAESMALGARPYGVAVVTSNGWPAPNNIDNLFVTGVTPARMGQALARYLKERKEQRPDRLAVLTPERSDSGKALAEAFAQELRDSAIKIDRISYKAPSPAPQTEDELSSTNAGAVLCYGARPDFVKKLRAKMPNALWLYAGDERQLAALQEDPQACQGMIWATAYAVDNDAKFASEYRKRFKEEPDVHAALAYDNARLLIAAIRRAMPPTPASVRDALGKSEILDGVTGPMTVSAERTVSRPVFVVRHEEGRAKVLRVDGGK